MILGSRVTTQHMKRQNLFGCQTNVFLCVLTTSLLVHKMFSTTFYDTFVCSLVNETDTVTPFLKTPFLFMCQKYLLFFFHLFSYSLLVL